MLFIITPVFNRKSFTEKYLLSLQKQTYSNFKVIIIDDGSTDGTYEMISEKFKDVILIKGDGNLWWAEATNIGIKKALELKASSIMTLNDDTIAEINYIEKMLYWHNKHPNALLGAFAMNIENKSPCYGGQIRNNWTGKSKYLLDTLKKENQTGIHEVNVFPGRGLLFSSDLIKKIGMFDHKNFPQMVADMDFTTRAFNQGYKIFCNYDAKIYTYPGESAGIKLLKEKNIKNFYNHLFSIKGSGNLIWLYKFAFKNLRFYYWPSFLVIGTISKILTYFKKY